MEKAKKIRLLTEKDVELRVKQTWENKNGVFALLLVYKEARTDMNILDETFGPMNWKRNHKLVGNTMYCSISVWDEDKHHRADYDSEGTALIFLQMLKKLELNDFKTLKDLYKYPFIVIRK